MKRNHNKKRHED